MKKIPDLPTGILEHLMKILFPMKQFHHVTINSIYSPTLISSDEEKKESIQILTTSIKSTAANDEPILLGDFNARIRKDSNNWRDGMGKMNTISSSKTLFRQVDKYKTTWMHSRSNLE